MTQTQDPPMMGAPSAMTEAAEQLTYEWTFEQQQQHLGPGAQNTQLGCLGAPSYCTASLS